MMGTSTQDILKFPDAWLLMSRPVLRNFTLKPKKVVSHITGQMKKNRLKIVQAICEYLSRFLVIFVRFASI